MHYVVKAKEYILKNGEKAPSYLEIKDGKFRGFHSSIPNGLDVLDYSIYTIAPGLFDTHIHGLAGYDVMDGEVEAIQGISKALASIGVTRFLPTTLTSSNESLEQAIVAVGEAVDEGLAGALSEGIFLEGPYFTEKHKGAQNPSYFKNPSIEEYKKWQEVAKGQVVKIALAPEREQTLDFIEAVKGEVRVSIAHSDATFDQCTRAVEAGASNFVHLFNGMSGLHHREPGVVGAAFIHKDTSAELICDGHHVHPEVATLAASIKGERLVLISDSMRAALMPDGDYSLGEFPVTMENGIARTKSGSLAGSTLKLIDGVKNLQQWSGFPLHKVWHLASLSAAKSVGMADRLGSIAANKEADFVVLDDQLNVVTTVVAGKIVYEREK